MEEGHLIHTHPVEESSSSASANRSAVESRILKPRSSNVDAEGSNCGSSSGLSCNEPSSVPTGQAVDPTDSTSASPSALVRHPFTHNQRVQLYAQIIVTGSLKNREVPDEESMVSAFGESDGGRSVWEKTWCMARKRHQKSQIRTPQKMCCSSGGRLHDQDARQRALQSSAVSTLASPAGGNDGFPVAKSTFMSVSSPLWTVPSCPRDGSFYSTKPKSSLQDSDQALTLLPFQSPPVIHQSSEPQPTLIQHLPPVTTASWGHDKVPKNFSTETPQSVEMARDMLQLRGHTSDDLKSSKGDNSFASEEHGGIFSGVHVESVPVPTSIHLPSSVGVTHSSNTRPEGASGNFVSASPLIAQNQQETISSSCQLPRSVAITSLTSPTCKAAAGGAVSNISLTSFMDDHTGFLVDMEERSTISDKLFVGVEQAKLQAEEASKLASSALCNSRSIWCQLAIQKSSGLSSDVEMKLASAAVAAASASSITKAAAAAAKVASDAALQAKTMAIEALTSTNLMASTQSSETLFSDLASNTYKLISASILKGDDKNKSPNISITSEEEAVSRSVKAAAHCAKWDEILSAVVKAAKLASGALSQVRTIAMGESAPPTLLELVEAGLDGYLKALVSSEQDFEKYNTAKGERCGVVEKENMFSNHMNRQCSSEKEAPRHTKQEETPHPTEVSGHSVESQEEMVIDKHQDFGSSVRAMEEENLLKVSESTKSTEDVLGSGVRTRNSSSIIQDVEHEEHNKVENLQESNIREGSLVEVLLDEDGFRGVWFPAKVLNMRDGEAYVLYSVRFKGDGSRHLTEWVSFTGEESKAPRIRLAQPLTGINHEGTRKRWRVSRGYCSWCSGDRVDAFINDGWWEGIIQEKSKEDETRFTVYFPAQRETLVVPAHKLRPSFIWKDGHWMELSSSRETICYSNEDNTPLEKRVKLGSHETGVDHALEARGKNLAEQAGNMGPEKPEDWRPHSLSSKEKAFTLGKKVGENKRFETFTSKRSGPCKERSGVTIGVPSVGKNTKFVEVNKLFVGVNKNPEKERFQESKANESDGISGVDTKGKRVAEYKRMGLKKGKKRHNIPSGSLFSKNASTTVPSKPKKETEQHLPNAKTSVHQEEDTPETRDLPEETNSLCNPHSHKREASVPVEGDALTEVKGPPTCVVSVKDEVQYLDHNNSSGVSEGNERRRSNRRIQPTSRLLEGLQVSCITKRSSISHEKGTKSRGIKSSRN